MLSLTQINCALNYKLLSLLKKKGESMEIKTKAAALKKEEIRYNEFLRYLQKRMKELERDEKMFRDAIIKDKKVN
jgi:hypothetical protein